MNSRPTEPHNLSDSTLVDLLRWRAIHQAERHAYTFLGHGETAVTHLTYGELDRQARAIAARLQRLGATGERALLLYPPGLEFIASFFGCLYAGCGAIPASPPRPNRAMSRIQGIVTDAQATVALTTTALFSDLERWCVPIPELQALCWLASDQVASDLELSWQAPAVKGDTLAYLQYTSGSTSTPRGVMVSHTNVLHNAGCIQQAFALTSESISVSWLPHFHDMGLIDGILEPVYSGFPGFLMSPVAFLQQPTRWLQAISRYRATHCGAPNFAYELCVSKIPLESRKHLDLSSWSSAYNGAEPVRPATLERFTAAFQPCGFRASAFSPCYGLAEATLMVSGGPVGNEPVTCVVEAHALEQHRVVQPSSTATQERQLVGCGRSWCETQIVIVAPESQRRCAPQEVGEIWVASASVAQGYWRKPEETRHTFQAYIAETGEGPFLRTGDMGFLRDGELFVTGRLKDLLIILGRNHYPQDIELTVEQSHQAIRSGCGAVVEVSFEGEERLAVIYEVERRYLRQLDVEAVAGAIRQSVAQQHALQIYAVVLLKTGSIPKTTSGKIQRHACRAGFVVGTLDEVGRSLLELWDELEGEAGLSREEYWAMTPENRQQQLVSYLQKQVARILKVAPSRLDTQHPLSSLGLDSLMAVEIKHHLEAHLKVTVSIADLLQGASVAQLAAQAVAQWHPTFLQPSTAFVPFAEQRAEYPLSHGQMALWFLHQMAPESAAYNVSLAARIVSDVDVTALRQALQVLSDRHAMLRVTFPLRNGQPVQRHQEQVQVVFEEIDATAWSREELQEQLVKSAHQAFDLAQEPPMRVSLLRRAIGEDVLLLTVHHIAMDFWSLEVLLGELRTLYAQMQAGRPISLPPLVWQYADYVRWQADMLAGREGERLWNYWQQQLAGELPVLHLPADRPRSPMPTSQGAVQTFQLDGHFVRHLKMLAQSEGVTVYMLLLAAFQVLLYRYTAQEDIVVGSPTAGRSRAELSGIVGYFVNPVVLRVNLSHNPTFQAFLAQVRHVVSAALEHQDYPFPLLVKRLQPARDLSYSPLFQVMFVLEQSRQLDELAAFGWGTTGSRMDWGGLLLESLAVEQGRVPCDLTLTMIEVAEGLAGSWQYDSNVFDASRIARMTGHFQNVLADLVADPQQHVQELALLSAAERHQVLVEWNNTQSKHPQDQCIHQLFETQVERTPDAVAVVGETQQLTYRELNGRANQVAHYLRALGIGPDVLVGICVERSIAMVVGLLGILKAGGAYLPLDPTYPQERLAFMLLNAHVPVLLTSEQVLAGLPEHDVHVVRLDAHWTAMSREHQDNPTTHAKPTNLAYVLYTSGSTGEPKGVAVEHRSTVAFLHWAREVYTSEQLAGVLASTSLSFDLSVFELFVPLCWGGQVVLAENALHLPTLPAAQQVTLLNTVPSTIAELLRIHGIPAGVRTVNLAGEPLSHQLVQQLYEHDGIKQVFNLYGPTEATTYATFTLAQKESSTSPTIGRPITNTQVYILDSHLHVVPIGVVGELYIGGAGLARGYLYRPDLTSEKFIPNPFSHEEGDRLYKTGDLARYLPDGHIEFLGRRDYQVKMRGFRIELGEIESVLAQHPMVRETAVIVREENAGNQRLIAYVVPQQEPPVERELRSFLKEKLPQYMVPQAFVLLDSMPLTPNGKIDRRALPHPKDLRPQLPATSAMPQTEAEHLIAAVWQEILQLENVGIHDNFFDLGGHSLLMAQVHSRLRDIFRTDVSIVDLFHLPTISSLAEHFCQEKDGKFFSQTSGGQSIDHSIDKINNDMYIAIVGMSCRFPGAQNIEIFWQNLSDGVESISFFSNEELRLAGVEQTLLSHPKYVKAKAILPDIELFDAAFFGLSPKEATIIDPQHRLFLEVSWEALENAGYNPKTFGGKIGVYAGVGMNTYLFNNLYQNHDVLNSVGEYQMMIGNDKDFLPTRISYKLNLNGPSVNIQTACSTSLVAVHLACQSLRNGECDMALAGGVSVRVPQQVGYMYQEGMILSPDGHCRAFDAQSQGTVPGNGIGIVVLKRLADAIADGDCIQAIIKGSAINNDGAVKVGYTAPSVDGQAAVIADAQAMARIDPETITYIEAHGTGTALGDPVEIAALTQAFHQSTHKQGFCAIGSVKTNIGHLDAAAGIAGLIKTVLALKHKLLPPSLHFAQPNPQIDFANSPFYVNTKLSEWPTGEMTRRAGVSAFGIGGTNAHIILEEAPETSLTAGGDERPQHLLTLSATSETVLQQLAQRYASYLASQDRALLPNVCFTANVGRAHFNYRLAVVAESPVQLGKHLAAFAAGSQPSTLLMGTVQSSHPPKVAFLFTGQGAQYIGMGRQLYDTQPTFRAALDRCQDILRPVLPQPLLAVLYPGTPERPLLAQTAYTQPALFALEYALAELWQSWGITPQAVLGHSVGEYVAACVAGVFSLEEGLKLVAARGRLMQALPPEGAMVAVRADRKRVAAAIHPYAQEVAIAAINGPASVVISGKRQAVEVAVAGLHAAGVATHPLQVSHAFHSPLMEPILAEFEQVASQVTYAAPRISLVSNVTGTWATEEIGTAAYWCRQIRQPVQFMAGIETLHAQGCAIFVEIGPQPTLVGMGRHCLPDGVGVWLPSLRQGQAEWSQLLQSVGALYVRGVAVDWAGFDRDYPRRRVVLPTYPFQQQRYWINPSPHKQQTAMSVSQEQSQTSIVNLLNQGDIEQLTQLLEKGRNFSEEQRKFLPDLLSVLVKEHQQQIATASISDWIYHLEWQPKPCQLQTTLEPTQIPTRGSWLILADQQGVGQTLASLLEELGHRCLLVFAGKIYQTEETAAWTLDPSKPGDFELLFQEALVSLDLPLQGIVHLWGLETAPTEELTIPSLAQAQIFGCGSVLHLVQTLVKHTWSVSPQVWLVTRGAMSVGTDTSSIAVAQTPVWGLGKVIALEHPQLWGGMIDLDPGTPLDEAAARLLEAIRNGEGEDHLAFRGGQRHAARLKCLGLSGSQGVPLRPDGTYLITGGLGALGLRIARWMVEQGARHVVLLGRHAASIEAQESLSQLEHAGAKILVVQADVSHQGDMVRVLEEVKVIMPPLRGIIHAAGVLDDATLQTQNWERFTRVMAPKVEGTWNLHQLTQKLPLDFFVLFSSAASLLGSPGQGNYAAANAFMDALAHYRRRIGLPGVSINWGPWAETGMAARLSSRSQGRLTTQGLSPIALEPGLQVLESVLGSLSAQVGVLPANWALLRQQCSPGQPWQLLSDLVGGISSPKTVKQTSATRREFVERLEKVPTSERHDILITHIQVEVAQVLGLEPSQLPKLEQGFSAMGMDSLMALELKNRLEASLGFALPSTLAFEYPTIKSLAEYIARELLQWESIATINQELRNNEDKRAGFLSEIERLTDEEIQTAIAQEMAALETLLKEDDKGFL